jgi:hypothetical protein
MQSYTYALSGPVILKLAPNRIARALERLLAQAGADHGHHGQLQHANSGNGLRRESRGSATVSSFESSICRTNRWSMP